MDSRLQEVVASALQLSPDALTDDLAFNSTPTWDSMNHIALILALEEAYGVMISDDDVVQLTTIGAISDFVDRLGPEALPGQA